MTERVSTVEVKHLYDNLKAKNDPTLAKIVHDLEMLLKQRWYYLRYHRKNIARLREQAQVYQRTHRHESDVHNEQRFKRMALSGNSLSFKEFVVLCNKHDNKCVYCGRDSIKLVEDHIIPLSRGGSNSYDNIVPACISCNSHKGTMTRDEYVEFCAWLNSMERE